MQSKADLRFIGIVVASLLIAMLAGAYNAALWVAPASAADEVTVDAIVKALNKRTRQFRPGESAAAHSREIEELKRIRKTRGWNLHDRERLANVTQGSGQIDLTVYFAFDSAEISPQAEPVLNTLGEALARQDYKGRTFVLAGHTDARGTADYNQGLSERRAEAVKRYIVSRFKLGADDLLTAGYGFERLKDTKNPYAEENRRVQVVNLDE